jgi:hydrogenase maturation protein HypF
VIARRFHTTLADIVLDVARAVRARTRLAQVALSGGVFLNGILTLQVETQLVEDGFQVYRQRVVSPGDGGLSLGQLAVAAAVVGRPKER